ncbi:hypothetical protein C8J57DRAFT_1626053 [Mycena rebaudengoi]|nr:hypothetical protein C8J57DRAFT_1626053 [Mycena rebaudengoi]
MENIQSTEELFDKVNDHVESLVDVSRESSGYISTSSLASGLRKLGVNLEALKQNGPRRANLATTEEDPRSNAEMDLSAALEEPLPANETLASGDEGMETLRQVYQTLAKRQRAPPKRGYPYAKNDHVTTKMGKKPPSPCKVCGSNNHWDRECPDWSVYIERSKRGVFLVVENPAQEELDMFYHSAYCVLLENQDSSPVSERKCKTDDDDFKTTALELDNIATAEEVSSAKTEPELRRRVYKVQIEEIEEEYWETQARMPKARKGLIELDSEPDVEDVVELLQQINVGMGADFAKESQTFEELAPPPVELSPIILPRRRHPKPGSSALGISVLSVKGWVGDLENGAVDLRLDSCADITLVSEEFHQALPNPPRIREGHHMNLAQLTDMGHNHQGEHVVRADGVDPITDKKEIHSLATSLTIHADSVTRIKQHRRHKAAQRRKRLRLGAEGNLVRASSDIKVRPHTCKTIEVSGDFRDDREWLVQKNMLANADDSFFVIPNTLISSKNPVVPVSNISDPPRYIRKGEILGSIVDPQDYFEAPGSQDQKDKLDRSVKVIKAIIEAMRRLK